MNLIMLNLLILIIYLSIKIIKKFLKSTNVQVYLILKSFSRNSSINTSTMILKKGIIKIVKFRNIQKHEDYIFKCEVFKKNKNLFAKNLKNTRIL